MHTLQPRLRPAPWLAPVLMLLLFLGALFAWSMHRDLNHDEHQFLAPGALLGHDGLLPYRDYPIFHLPNLTFIYAALSQITGHAIFAAKLFSVFCSWGLGILFVVLAYKTPPLEKNRLSFAAACLAVGFLFFDPLFGFTSGKTWNHEFPALLAVAAVLSVVGAARRDHLGYALLAGLLAGTAIGTRLTFAPILAPLGLAWFFLPSSPGRRLRMALTFTGATLLALLPCIILLATDPEPFLFGNFGFPRLNGGNPNDLRAHKNMIWWRKLRFFFKEVALPSWPLFTLYLSLGLAPALSWFKRRTPETFPCALVLGVLPFLLLGCSTPSRYQYQHYFILIPFLILGSLYGAAAADFWRRTRPGMAIRWAAPGLFAATFALYLHAQFFMKNATPFAWVANAFDCSTWFPLKAHALSQTLRGRIGPGKVLTLAPAWIVEAGLPIYPEFASGPFAWRSAFLVLPERRQRLKMVAPEDLETFLAACPPAAILTGFEAATLEAPFLEYAHSHGYRREKFGKNWQLWIAPAPL